MAIDRSGKWWKGNSPEDIFVYLDQLFADSYPIHEHRLAVCPCGSEVFSLCWIPDEGAVKRICGQCGTKHFVCDSEENWDGRPKKFKCIECKSDKTNLGVAFSLYENRNAIRWIYTGCRCTNCGVLASFADWKIACEPSIHLLSQV